mgnify:CR=1 FL=1
MHNKGTVIIEKTVDRKIIFAVKGASPSYFAAKIAMVVAAGIPAKITDTCFTNSSTPKRLQPKMTRIGMISNRTTQNHNAFKSNN